MVLERVVITACNYSFIFIVAALIINVYINELVTHLEKSLHLFVILKHLPILDIIEHHQPMFDFDLILSVGENGNIKN